MPARLPHPSRPSVDARSNEFTTSSGGQVNLEHGCVDVSVRTVVATRTYRKPSNVGPMRTTVELDDDLVRLAQELIGVEEKTALIREALKALIERGTARRLASLGGKMPGLENIPRRRLRQKQVAKD